MHHFQCRCGVVRGEVDCRGTHNRIICYCTDCQAFGRFLGPSAAVLDGQGGTEIVQVAQSKLHFTQGQDQLLALRLSETGMIRWYAGCCKTAIGNTMPSPGGAFIGLIHCCLDRSQVTADFGSKIALLETETALGSPKPLAHGLFGVISRFFWLMLTERVSGRYRQSPFFEPTGLPIIQPRVLTSEELFELKK
ncbi:MAG: hypothetical protein KKF79_09525 [Gammaproteobacteria bacterium]|nr:hypothetical protein [Gammaproteobacteria bacterium]MBU2226003.1 hypothetical protein [Gammaproteobacteria bacterium]